MKTEQHTCGKCRMVIDVRIENDGDFWHCPFCDIEQPSLIGMEKQGYKRLTKNNKIKWYGEIKRVTDRVR